MIAVWPGLVPRAAMLALKAEVEEAYKEAAQCRDEAILTALRWGGLPMTFLRNQEAIRPVLDAVERREGWHWASEFSVFRRIVPDTYIYWHADMDGAGSWSADPVNNVWMPLEDVGEEYPSLQIIANSEARMRAFGPNPPGHRPDEWVAANFPDADIVCPALGVGDALVFGHYLLHRTQPVETMKRLRGPRIGCEFRFREAARRPWWQRAWRRMAA